MPLGLRQKKKEAAFSDSLFCLGYGLVGYSCPVKSTFVRLSVISTVRDAKRYCREATPIV